MYSINEIKFNTLDEAIACAKLMNEFVTIKGNGLEICGKFGVDEIKDGKTPDGHEYGWTKRRIGEIRPR
jgi:hypothetical protein